MRKAGSTGSSHSAIALHVVVLILSAAAACAPSPHSPQPIAPVAPAATASSPPPATATAPPPSPSAGVATGQTEPELPAAAAPYREIAARILDESRRSDGAFRKVAYLADHVGARPSGSKELDLAVAWAQATLAREGHEKVALEKVRVPHWVRGDATAEILSPVRRKLPVLALGGSVPSPRGGLEAEVVVVRSFEELERLGAAAKNPIDGKIVLFDHPMSTEGNAGRNYGEALPYRITGAARASKFGARAVLVRSVTARSLATLHTGSMRYGDATTKIPAATVTIEDADLLARLAAEGKPPRVRLSLATTELPDADSANVVAELRGREKPDEIVLIGAHIDSWDVGPGAQDDGAGCAIVMEALTTLRMLKLVPRRTIRAVLFTNEENGLRGALSYAETHREELERHVAAFETDIGAGAPIGFMTDGPQAYEGELRDLATLLAPVGSNAVMPGYPGEDVKKLEPWHVPLFGLFLDPSHYFDVHHSAADTIDKIDPVLLQKSVATLATMAFVVADRPGSFRPPPEAMAKGAP